MLGLPQILVRYEITGLGLLRGITPSPEITSLNLGLATYSRNRLHLGQAIVSRAWLDWKAKGLGVVLMHDTLEPFLLVVLTRASPYWRHPWTISFG